MANNILGYFKELKAREGFVVYDTHVHPFEVIGVCPIDHTSFSTSKTTSPSLLEKLDFSALSLFILEKLFMFAPKYINTTVKGVYTSNNFENLKRELSIAGVDKCVVVPVAPCADTRVLEQYVKSEQFVVLGTIDIHKINYDDIEEELMNQINEYGIKGVKLHPNIQKFFPIPSHNPTDLSRKLTRLYEVINKLNLYVLFHSGNSYLPSGDHFEKVSYAILENYFDDTIDIFNSFSVPVVLAHMGSYNVKYPNLPLLKKILKDHHNVYLDTAGVNSRVITQIVDNDTCKRIIFGSDARYFDIKYSVYRVLRALKKSPGGLSDEVVRRIFSQNYLEILNFNQ